MLHEKDFALASTSLGTCLTCCCCCELLADDVDELILFVLFCWFLLVYCVVGFVCWVLVNSSRRKFELTEVAWTWAKTGLAQASSLSSTIAWEIFSLENRPLGPCGDDYFPWVKELYRRKILLFDLAWCLQTRNIFSTHSKKQKQKMDKRAQRRLEVAIAHLQPQLGLTIAGSNDTLQFAPTAASAPSAAKKTPTVNNFPFDSYLTRQTKALKKQPAVLDASSIDILTREFFWVDHIELRKQVLEFVKRTPEIRSFKHGTSFVRVCAQHGMQNTIV